MGAWIETMLTLLASHYSRSHPSWVRGLKRLKVEEHMKDEVSHPSWVRGLKLAEMIAIVSEIGVAPLVGAWIETMPR